MRVLCICAQGMNRSRFLAEHLHRQGYETDFAGIGAWTMNRVTQGRIDWADVIVVARPQFAQALTQEFSVEKRIIELDAATGEEERLIGQLDEHLPF